MDFEEAPEELPNNPGDYEGVDGRSTGIIDFDAMPGFGFRWGSQISSRFERSIRLMILPPFPTIGFSYSSRPMPSMHQAMEEAMAREMEALQDEEDAGEGQAENGAEGEAESAAEAKPLLRPLDVAVLSKVGAEVTERPDNDDNTTSSEDEEEEEEAEQKESGGHFMLSAEATFDGMVQGMYMQRFNKNWSTRHMILTSMEPGRSMLMSSLSYSGGSFTSKLSWNSERDRACFSHMQAITQRLSIGGEVGYAMKDKQPVGWSVGGRYVIRKEEGGKFAATHITATYNHLGRVKTTYTLPFSETVFASARYTVNAFSFKSNMAVGVESWPSATMPLMTKAKWDTDKGFGVSLGAHLGLAALMFSASYGKDGPMVGLHFEL